MPIQANVTNNQITAAVSETQIDVSVSGGVGPTGSQGPSGTLTVSAPLVNSGTSSAASLSISVGSGLTTSGGTLALASHTHAIADVTGLQGALDLRARINNPTFTGTVSGVTKAHVGLGNVQNVDATARANHTGSQAISTVAGLQAALDGKAAASHAHGNITSDGRIGTEGGAIVVASAGGVLITSSDLDGYATIHNVNIPDLLTTQFPTDQPLGDVLFAIDTALAGKAAASHAHGSLTSDGRIGTTSGQIVVTTSGGVLTTAATVPAGNLPKAAANTLGAVRIGSGIIIDGDGVISAAGGYTLPQATASILGGVTVSTGLSVASGALSVAYGSSAGTACQGNDARLSDSRTPTAHNHAAGDITSGTLAIARLPVRARAAINVFNWSSFR